MTMLAAVTDISWTDLAWIFLPVAVVIAILQAWKLEAGNALYGMIRMLVQLIAIGFVLKSIFESDSGPVVLGVLGVMLLAAAWISLRTSKRGRRPLLAASFVAILVGGGGTLVLVTQVVVDLESWYQPRYVIPLAGMIFAAAMTAISLAVERLEAELERGDGYVKARGTAYRAALIPITNSLFAVGLVSLPGMMTGQILSGVSSFVAARYQIMVMGMLFASAGISAALFLVMTRRTFATG